MFDIKDYVRCLERLKTTNAHALKAHTAKDVQYSSPLSVVQGDEAMVQTLSEYVRVVGLQKWRIYDVAEVGTETGENNQFFLSWEKMVEPRSACFVINGMSRISLDVRKEKVISHEDFFDPIPLYQGQTPLFSYALKRAIKKMYR